MQILFAVFAYLCGSLPFGFWIGKIVKGKDFDIRDWGSGNIGFTNVWKVLGIKVGLPVLAADILKSWWPVFLAKQMGFTDAAIILSIIAGGIGHGCSIVMYLHTGKFSGGKSVATFFGGFLAAQPIVALVALTTWLSLLIVTKYMFLASIMGGVAVLVASIVLGKGPLWIGTSLLVLVYLVFKHLPNISRWMHGIEPKINQKRGPSGGETIVAFAVHPRDEKDLAQSPVFKHLEGRFLLQNGVISIDSLEKLAQLEIAVEVGEVTGIVCKGGERVRVLLFAIPFSSDQIRKKDNWDLITKWLETAAVAAQRRGAIIMGLGGLLSTVNKDGGHRIQSWLLENGHKIRVDNGSEKTSAATIKAAMIIAGDKLASMLVADVGARGYIGRGTGEGLSDLVADILPVIKHKDATSDEPLDFTSLATTADIANLEKADMVILCTNSPGRVIGENEIRFIKKGAIVLDVAYPPDFDEQLLEKRDDITLIRCGLILPPGDPKCQIDFHFGHVVIDGKERFLIPACLAQTIIRGITGKEIVSLSRPPTKENVLYFGKKGEELGFKVIVSKYSEQEIYSGEVEAPK